MTWKIECSIAGAFAPGSGLRYNEIMVMPFENCSTWDQRVSSKRKLREIHVLTDVFPREVQGIEVVQVRERAAELLGAAHLVADDDAALARALDLEHLDDGPVALLDGPHHALVDLERVLARLLQEHGI